MHAEARRQDEKIGIIIDVQIQTDERLAEYEIKLTELVESQVHTDRRLDALIEIIRGNRS